MKLPQIQEVHFRDSTGGRVQLLTALWRHSTGKPLLASGWAPRDPRALSHTQIWDITVAPQGWMTTENDHACRGISLPLCQGEQTTCRYTNAGGLTALHLKSGPRQNRPGRGPDASVRNEPWVVLCDDSLQKELVPLGRTWALPQQWPGADDCPGVITS